MSTPMMAIDVPTPQGRGFISVAPRVKPQNRERPHATAVKLDVEAMMNELLPVDRARVNLHTAIVCEYSNAINDKGMTKAGIARASETSETTVQRVADSGDRVSLDKLLDVLAVFGKTLVLADLPA